MIKSINKLLGVSLLIIASSGIVSQAEPTDAAVKEAVMRQANTITLRNTLAEAQAAERAGDLEAAVKLYEKCLKLAESIGPNGIDSETAAVRKGLGNVRLQLAKEAQKYGDLRSADVHINRALAVNPNDSQAIAFKADNDRRLKEMEGLMPDKEYLERVPEWHREAVANSTKVQNAKLLYENGKYAEAQEILKQVLKDEPDNYAASYYLSLIKESHFANETLKREITTKGALLEVEEAWEAPVDRLNLPTPNPYANTNLIHTSSRRQAIAVKLERIHLDNVFYDGLPFSEVLRNLAADVKKRDPDQRGVNFIVAPQADGAGSRSAAPVETVIDPATGLPVVQPAFQEEEPVDLGSISIKINPALSDVSLGDLLDIMVKVAERPIKYSIEDYGIVFSVKSAEPVPLHTRTFRVDPNTFWMGLANVTSSSFGDISTGNNNGGGGGGNRGGGGGGSGGGNNNNNNNGGGNSLSIPRVDVAGFRNNNQGGGGGNQFGQNNQGQGGGGGLGGITAVMNVATVQEAVRNFFGSLGVDLTPPKTVFFNDRQGTLIVRATLRDLDIIEQAIQVLNIVPPQVNIQSKVAEITQNDQKALGFDWFLGNTLIGNGDNMFQGGTAPSYVGAPSEANPQGFFPGTSVGTAIPSLASDQLITSGLGNPAGAPALFTLTGILTDPQYRLVIRALEKRAGVEVLTAPEVTTVSGRQAQLQAVDIRTVVTGTDLTQNTSGGGVGDSLVGGGGGAVGSTLEYQTQPLPFGPVLDVIPYVSADGYTVQMVLIPTITEFLGYDDPGGFVPQAQSVSSGAAGVGLPITAQLPLPRFRVRQVTTTAIVWDGQTVVLGGLLSENVTKSKDKVPFLGDLPFFGRLFRSESNVSEKKNLVIFVTPTIIDPAGNRMNSDDDLPFRKRLIPPQAPVTTDDSARARN